MNFKCEYPHSVIILRAPMPIPPGSELWEFYEERCLDLALLNDFLAIEVRHVESHCPFVASARFGRRDGTFVCARNSVQSNYVDIGIEDFPRELAEAVEQHHLDAAT